MKNRKLEIKLIYSNNNKKSTKKEELVQSFWFMLNVQKMISLLKRSRDFTWKQHLIDDCKLKKPRRVLWEVWHQPDPTLMSYMTQLTRLPPILRSSFLQLYGAFSQAQQSGLEIPLIDYHKTRPEHFLFPLWKFSGGARRCEFASEESLKRDGGWKRTQERKGKQTQVCESCDDLVVKKHAIYICTSITWFDYEQGPWLRSVNPSGISFIGNVEIYRNWICD